MEEETKQQPTTTENQLMLPPSAGFLMPSKIKKESAVKEKQEPKKLENKWSIIEIDLAVVKPPTEIEEFSKLNVYSLPDLK